MTQALPHVQWAPVRQPWKGAPRNLYILNAVTISIILMVVYIIPRAPRCQIGSGAMVSSQYYPEPNDDLDPVPPHETSFATDAEVVNEFIEDSKIGSDAHSQVLTFNKSSSMLTSLTRENFQFSDIQLSPPNRKILTI